MNRYYKRYGILLALVSIVAFLSFTSTTDPKARTAAYYDRQLNTLLSSLTSFNRAAVSGMPKDTLLQRFFTCRQHYKAIELFVDVFLMNKARIINGPDLLRIDEENPSDSMKPHGFQHIESILYADRIDKTELAKELKLLTVTITRLRNDPDRIYYFTDDKIWTALRLGTYRVISMGITGFDVPLSYHALPEARATLSSIQQIAGFYKEQMADSIWNAGNVLFKNADSYLAAHNDFNTFDRLSFIRHYLAPISSWLAQAGRAYVNTHELYPIAPYASHLFAKDVFNTDFFSLNSDMLATPQRVALGKRLFYDPILSGNGRRSCASCHKPELAFTDGLVKPMDLSGKRQLQRNTPTLWNAALQTAQFYDSRAKVLERQLSAVVHNADEMNGSLLQSVPRLAADSIYAGMFRKAYAADAHPISEHNIANAVSSYIRTLVALDSRFDKYMRMETDSLTASERNGFNLFMGKAKCGTCHYAPLFNGLTPPLYQDTESETLAVPATDAPRSALDDDLGKAAFTQHPFHRYSFKTPTVRNSALTAPYMHNGVFATLDAVLDFYDNGGGAGRGIDLPTQTLPAEKLHLTKKEKKDIIAFLHTLTDTTAAR
ncbi:cytochrome c peroxidase [Nemorincola caseinilytica]|uniref:Cytochrome c peroxidase n=1 Tax=Nemorincola caseinilytica TaxID=2054315 RepID=A0ABP8N6G3_9BACT